MGKQSVACTFKFLSLVKKVYLQTKTNKSMELLIYSNVSVKLSVDRLKIENKFETNVF